MQRTGVNKLRSSTATWPNQATMDLHDWAHLHAPLRAAKRAANQHLAEIGGAWTEVAVAKFLTRALVILPPGLTVGELPQVNCRWLAIIWNHSAGLANQLHLLNQKEAA